MQMRILPVFLLLAAAGLVVAQTTPSDIVSEVDVEALPAPSASLLSPVFPADGSTFLVQIEAEDAVSTNFAKSATLNYGASGYRALQLNRYTELFGGAAFYAEYVVYLQEPATYEMWYGGTPPGPQDEVFPSYASPFSYSIDGGKQVEVYREQVNVVERYSPNFYWVKYGEVELGQGVHRIRIEVSEKRKYDGKFFFFLDSLFFLDPTGFEHSSDLDVPAVFPKDLNNRSIDTPFGTVNDFRYLVSVEPDNAELYVEFSLIYAFVGDYQNALRNVNKAMLLDPNSSDARMLAAKYRLWKGEADESLKIYRSLLELHPELLEGWTEAGKVAAWIGKYDESVDFYDRALEHFPDNLNLTVNKALTYLWASKEGKANEIFDSIGSAVSGSVELVSELGDILVANGYADRAAALYRESLKRFPEHVILYLRLQNAYTEAGHAENSSAVRAAIVERLAPSERLQTFLDTSAIEQNMKDQVIQSYLDALAAEPDNLILREQLVQTYFWNGLRARAIEEYHNILVNYAYNTLSSMDRRSVPLFELIDELLLYEWQYNLSAEEFPRIKMELGAALKAYTAARGELEKFDQKVQKAKKAGNPVPEPAGTHPSLAVDSAENGLAMAVSATEAFMERISQLIARSTILLELRDGIVQSEQLERDGFLRLTSATAWRWDQSQTTTELKTVSANGYGLADYVLGRIYSLQGLHGLGRPSLIASEPAGGAPTEYALLQDYLWSGSYEDYTARMAASPPLGYAPYLERLASLLNEFSEVREPTARPSSSSIPADVEEVADRIDQLETDLGVHRTNVQDAIALLKDAAGKRLERSMYEYQQETYLIRFELGDYYLLDGDYGAAVEQLGYVLAIDPENTSAIFNLGVLNQRLGRWRRAMEDYRHVYDADPRFVNVSANYNLLARQYADAAAFSHMLTIDSGRVNQKATLSFDNSISSILGFSTSLASETVRMYQEFGGQTPWTYQIYDLRFGVPLSASSVGVSVTPDIGLLISSGLADESISDQELSAQPGSVIGTYSLEPVMGGSVYLTAADHLFLAGKYRYGRTYESLRPGATRIVSHEANVDVRLDLAVLPWRLFEQSFATIGGYYHLLTGGPLSVNELYGVTQNLSMVFHLADSPWTDITVSEQLSFQDSASPGASEYYAPDSALQMVGRIGASTSLEVGPEATVGIIANAGGGLSMSGNADHDPTRSLQLVADGRIEFTLGDVTYYIAAQGSAVSQLLPVFEYWSVSGSFGVRVDLPRLLAD